MVGTILDIMRLSTEDGPGVRTTVFFKGCTLRCAWCHNVESLDFRPQPVWQKGRCMGCGLCRAACKTGALQNNGAGFSVDGSLCARCLACADACPTGALQKKGRRYSAAELANELAKDAAYFGEQGGVTLSGGEALAQPELAAGLLSELKARGLHTAVDTCGFVPWAAFESALPYTDLVLYDLKLMDAGEHARLTGQDNALILENARRLCGSFGSGTKVWVRTPIIPGATDSEANIRAVGEFIRDHMPTAEKWELCAFNNLCRSKYEALGIDWDYKQTPLISKSDMDELAGIASTAWGKPAVWSGATRLE